MMRLPGPQASLSITNSQSLPKAMNFMTQLCEFDKYILFMGRRL